MLPSGLFFSFLVSALFGASFSPPGNPTKNCEQIPGTELYFARYEVSVKDYNDFLKGLVDEGKAAEVSVHAPKGEVWEQFGKQGNTNLAQNYFSNESFLQYPAVGISYESATAYCEWKTRQFAASTEERGVTYKFRLPTKSEWQKAATSGIDNAIYAGGNLSVKDQRDRYLYNFRPGENDWSADNYMYTAPIRPVNKLFTADKFGLCHMGGNVAEMVAEKGLALGGSWYHGEEQLRIEQQLNYDKPTSWLGFRYVIEVVPNLD